VSSIDNTYHSNHYLTTLLLPFSSNSDFDELENHIASATIINQKYRGYSHVAGRAKVIHTQLNCKAKMELCRLQDVHYSFGNIYAEMEPRLLPEVLALTGWTYGQDDLYRMVVATAPELASIVNRTGNMIGINSLNGYSVTHLNSQCANSSSPSIIFDIQNFATTTQEYELIDLKIDDHVQLCGKKRGRNKIS